MKNKNGRSNEHGASSSEALQITPIGYIHTAFREKFGIPRQSLLADNLSVITFEPEYRSEEYFRGLEGFSHIWILWIFSKNRNSKKHSTVRPPILGGNTRTGVFATRSPFRPNNIGLSLVKIHHIETVSHEGTRLFVTGADMLEGTPVIDIKPYIPYIESLPDAAAGFTGISDKKDVKRLHVTISGKARCTIENYFGKAQTDRGEKSEASSGHQETASICLETAPVQPDMAPVQPEAASVYPEIASVQPETASVYPKNASAQPETASADKETEIIKSLVSLDPRPRYQEDPERIYGMKYKDLDIRFRVSGKNAEIIDAIINTDAQ